MNSLIAAYKKILNLENATFSQIEHEDAMVAIVYRITQTDGKQLILKICDRLNDYLREVYFLKHFQGIVLVPKIIQLIPPDDSLHGAILMEHLKGELLRCNENNENLYFEIGRSLALIHENRLKGYGDPIVNNLSDDPRDYFNFKFEEGLNECNDHLPLDLLNKCRQYHEAQLNLLLAVDGPCMVHRDFRPGNIMVYDGKLQGIIDWSSARASFAEEDFCSLEHGEWALNPTNKKSLIAGYASIRPVPDYNRLMPFLRLNKAIATIGFTVKRGTWDTINACIYQSNRNFLKSLFGNKT